MQCQLMKLSENTLDIGGCRYAIFSKLTFLPKLFSWWRPPLKRVSNLQKHVHKLRLCMNLGLV